MKRTIGFRDSLKRFFGFDGTKAIELKANYDDVDDRIVDLYACKARRLQIDDDNVDSFIARCVQNHIYASQNLESREVPLGRIRL